LQTTRRSPGNSGAGDLGQIALVEQRKLEGAGIEQRADLRRPQRGDPIQSGGLQRVADAGAGDHTAVADQHHPR
jgi:hypothetical protein